MKKKFEYKITGLYLVLGFLWIVFSDMVLEKFITQNHLSDFQTYKGSFFIITTGVLLFFLIKKNQKKLHHINMLLSENNRKLQKSEEEKQQANEELTLSLETINENYNNLTEAKQLAETSEAYFKMLLKLTTLGPGVVIPGTSR